MLEAPAALTHTEDPLATDGWDNLEYDVYLFGPLGHEFIHVRPAAAWSSFCTLMIFRLVPYPVCRVTPKCRTRQFRGIIPHSQSVFLLLMIHPDRPRIRHRFLPFLIPIPAWWATERHQRDPAKYLRLASYHPSVRSSCCLSACRH